MSFKVPPEESLPQRGTSATAPLARERMFPNQKSMRTMSNYHKGKLSIARDTTQRLHPGMSSSRNRATAHYGAVTGLKATKDGMYLLSTGQHHPFSITRKPVKMQSFPSVTY